MLPALPKIAVQILCFNVDRYLPYVIENCYPFADQICLIHSPFSWGYGGKVVANPTRLESFDLAPWQDKLKIFTGTFASEQEMRNVCLPFLLSNGFDWLVVQDADEFYSAAGWESLRQALSLATCKVIKTCWINFWKSPFLVLENRDGSIKGPNATAAMRLVEGHCFVDRRITSCAEDEAIVSITCYHYGFVMSDREMRLKLATWGHAHEVNAKLWFALKWQQWTLASRCLHFSFPALWRRARLFDGDLPPFALEIFADLEPLSYRALYGLDRRPLYWRDLWVEFCYDTRALLRDRFRAGRRFLQRLS